MFHYLRIATDLGSVPAASTSLTLTVSFSPRTSFFSSTSWLLVSTIAPRFNHHVTSTGAEVSDLEERVNSQTGGRKASLKEPTIVATPTCKVCI